MQATHRSRSGFLALSLVALTWLVTCSSSAEDGESCSKGADCKSGHCGSAGSCEGSDCTCEGADCRGRSSCREGWLCTRTEATTFSAIPQCRQQCGATAGACPADKHCENGICRDGPEPFGLTWVNIPRTTACAPKVPCEYKVKPSSSVVVDKYTWTFESAPAPIETTEPTATFTYATGGSFGVLVRAHATSGATAELRTSEVLCIGALGADCDPGGAACCEGSCSAQLVCR